MRLKRVYLNSQKSAFDYKLISLTIALLLFGLLIVYDASTFQAYSDYKDYYYYIRQQGIWVLIGLVAAFIFANFDYHKLKNLSLLGLVGSLVLLMAVFIPGLGVSVGGAHRWLSLGIFSIQPVEIFKLAAVIWLAALFDQKPRLKPLLLLLGIGVVILALFQKDLGSTIVFVATSIIIYLVSGGPIWQLALVLPTGVIGFLALIFTSSYRQKRILAFLDPFSDTQGFTYHISQVLIALGSGGWFGLGVGQSRQKFYIPEVSTDSIFAIIGEEFGFLGSVLLILLFGGLIYRGFKIAENAPDRFGKILAGGLTAWLGIQAIINLSAMVALIPLTGVPLPFISYGGSALVANLVSVGILLNISKNHK